MVDYHTRRGEFTRAGYLSDQIIALTPWDQSAYAKSMQLYAAGKLWHTASIKYNQLRTYLEVNFSESPQLSMVALNKQIIELSLKDKALPLLIQTRKDTLPKLSSSFMGRVNEVLELSGMIANPKIRLLTIIGVGGIGKTRLAIEVGSLFRGLFKDGIFFIPLKEISSLKGFFHYIGDYLQYTFSGKASPQQQLINYMRGRQCLLILDGCEKETIKFLVADFISGLLDQALDIVILGTSRKRLGLEEEHVYVLTGLNCEPVLMAQNQELPEAVALLKRRILQTDSKFEFSESNLTALNKLCSQVDGHPLSIELIASAMATRSIAEIFSMIGDNQKKIQSLLTESSTQNPVLSIVLENSWISLPDQQKDAICCLTYFKQGFSKEAALKVTGISEDMFCSLIDKSLIRRINPDRFDFHEIIYSFFKDKAKTNDKAQLASEHHARYYLAFLEIVAEDFYSGDQVGSLLAFEGDLDNILSAWQTFIDNNELRALANCFDILYQYFDIRSLFEEGISLFQKTIHSSSYLDPFDPNLGVLANRLGNLAFRIHQNDMAFQMYTRAVNIFEREVDICELGISYLGLGNYYLRIKDIDKALMYASSGLDCFKKLGEKFQQGRALYLKAMIYQRFADYPTAKNLFIRALNLSREVDDQRGILLILNQLAGHACNDGDFTTAETYYRECLALSRAFKDRYQQAVILNNLASVFHPRQEYQLEENVLKQSLDICREIGDLDGQAIALNNLGELAVVQGEFNQAIDYCKEALDIALQLGEEWTIIVVYDILGCAYAGLQECTTATQCYSRATQLAIDIKSWDLLTRCAVNFSEVFLLEGNRQIAIDLLKAALAHPSTLFEFRQKASNDLEKLGVDYEAKVDEEMIFPVLNKILN